MRFWWFLIPFLAILSTGIALETYTLSNEVQVFDLNNSSKVIGTFHKDTALTLESEPNLKGLVKVSFQWNNNPKIEGYVRADDVGKENLVKDGVYEGSFVVPSHLFENPEIKVEFRIPVDAKGNPGPHADNLVFYTPWLPERKMMSKDYVRYFSDKLGFTVFSLNFTTQHQNVEVRDKCYYYPESGSFDAVFSAQDRLIKDFNLKRNKLLIFGISAGSTMAEQVAVHHPDKVEAVAIHGGWRYDLPKEHSDVKWCVTVSKGDFRSIQNEDLTNELNNMGFNVLYAVTSPTWKKSGTDKNWRHDAGPQATLVLQTFLQNIAELRETKGGVLSPEQWPWMASVDEQKKVLENKAETQRKPYQIQT